jgi:F-type H+-transporting ATPase subunit epsilon
MKKTMNMTIATPEGILFEGQVESAKFPGTSGSFMVLPMHAPLISSLTVGKVIYTMQGEQKEMHIQGGFVEVKNNVISVCVEV